MARPPQPKPRKERLKHTGRKSLLTPELQEEVCKVIRAGATATSAAAYVGVDVATLISWKNKGEAQKVGPYAEFLKAVRQAEAARTVGLLANIRKAGVEPKHWQANAWILERTDLQYAPRIKLHVEQELGAALDRLQKKLTPDEYEKALSAIVSDDGSPEAAPASEGEAETGAPVAAGLDTSPQSEIHEAAPSEAADGPDSEGD